MNSPIKLPAIPYELLESLADWEIPAIRAYAEQAVRDALAALKIDERAAFEDWVRMRHPESPSMLWREDEGYVYVNSEWDAWQARASLIPENNHTSTECGACCGTGRVVRDPDIGTDQECWVCDGSGHHE